MSEIPKIQAAYECRICESVFDNWESAMTCCNPVQNVFTCSDCEDEFDSIEAASQHLYLKLLRQGEPSLGEWAVAMEVEKQLDV